MGPDIVQSRSWSSCWHWLDKHRPGASLKGLILMRITILLSNEEGALSSNSRKRWWSENSEMCANANV